ncbi:MAG: hypothetical protein GXZ08_09460 [Tissierellia bacterium]|nr:hypothetical protein [Tissierellia bacterium]
MINFNLGDGGTTENKTKYEVYVNSPWNEIAAPIITPKEGKTFTGWDKTVPTTGEIKISTEFNAQYDTNKYTVTFNSNGGSDIASETVEHGNKVTKPADPTKANHTFGGWYTDTEFTKAYDFNSEVKNAFTLYAKWDINSHSVTFNSNGGTSIQSQSVKYGEKASKPSDPTRAGYVFIGWYDSELNNPYVFSEKVVNDITLYAKWEKIEQVRIAFKAGSGGVLNVGDTSFLVDKGSKWSSINTSIPIVNANSGYRFVKWNPSLPSGNSTINEDATYTAIFEKIPVEKVVIKFTTDGNGYLSGSSEITVDAGTSSNGRIPTPKANSGYEFDRWSPEIPSKFNYNETYKAIFKKKADTTKYVNIDFKTDRNGYLDGTTSFKVEKDSRSSDIKLPTPKAYSGYVFDRWSPSIPTRFNSSETYKAIFIRADKSTVTIKYVDRYDRRVAGTVVLEGRVGESYKAYSKEVDGYKLRDGYWPGNVSGKFTDKNINVTFTYTQTDIPYGKTRVAFVAGNNGEFKNHKGEYVDVILETINKDTKWKNIRIPSIYANSGYRHEKWSPALPNGETRINSTQEFKALFIDKNAPVGDITVRFAAGKNGKIEGNTRYDVKKGTKWTDISVPRPVADSGYYFNKWNPDFPKYIEKDVTYTAEFLPIKEQYEETHKAYIKGYPDGTFKPADNVTRAEASAMFTRVLTDDPRGYYNGFTDVKDKDWHNIYVSYLSDRGFIDGYPDGTFRPNVPMTRAEFAAIASRIKNLSGGYTKFKDVNPNHWAKEYIEALADGGVVKGYEDNQFRPDKYITREEAVTMINRLLDRKLDKDFVNKYDVQYTHYKDVNRNRWSFYDIQEASISHNAKMNKYDGERWIKIVN